MSSSSRSVYRPLVSEREEIRLLRLFPCNSPQDPLAGYLEIVSLTADPRFQSLSYAWGQAEANLTFQIGNGEINITQNLEDALKALRTRNSDVGHWVDAICINQSDVQERNHQVQLMRKIYTRALTVNIWLGTAFAGMEAAFGFLHELAEGRPLGAILSSQNDKTASVVNLTKIFQYAWWERLWVVQEVLLAEHALIYCSFHCVSFEKIMRAFELLWNEYVMTGQHLRRICGADVIDGLIQQLQVTVRRLHVIRNFIFVQESDQRRLRDDPRTWPYLLHSCSWSKVSDPRDKVYGALGLLPSSHIEPDYSSSIREVYTTSSFRIMKQMGNLALMSQSTSSMNSMNGLPSWVPDWREPSTSTAPFLVFHDLFKAGRHIPEEFNLLADGALLLSAAIVDEVKVINDLYDHKGCNRSTELIELIRPVMTAWMRLADVPTLSRNSFTEQFTEEASTTASRFPQLFKPADATESPQMLQNPKAIPYPAPVSSSLINPRLQHTDSSRDLQQHQPLGGASKFYQPVQSYNASLYKDADHSISTQAPGTYYRSMVAQSQQGTRRTSSQAFTMPQQSQQAPLYKDADYELSRGASKKRMTVAGKSTGNWHYDAFTHTYMNDIYSGGNAASGRLTDEVSTSTITAKESGGQYRPAPWCQTSEMFWRTACMDSIDCEKIKNHRRCESRDSVRFWEWLDWVFQNSKPDSIPQLHWHLNTHLQGKRQIKTKLGYLGLASKNVLPCDRICVLAGESYPYVLRPTGSEEGKSFKLVCPCYVHGLMDGIVPTGQPQFRKVYIT